MERTGLLDGLRSFGKQLLIAMDGTEYFYHLEHIFGHGNRYLSALLLSLNLLVFLFQPLLDLVDARYCAIRRKLGLRRTFFTDLDVLLRYLLFSSWPEVLGFMFKGLELDTGCSHSTPLALFSPAACVVSPRSWFRFPCLRLTFGLATAALCGWSV